MKYFLLVITFSIALCESLYSQSAFSFQDLETARPFTSLNYVHGIATTKQYNESKINTCIERSIQSLDSNSFISVLVEVFNENGIRYYEFPEYAIRMDSSITAQNMVIADSMLLGQDFICITSMPTSSKTLELAKPELSELKTAPTKRGNVWYSAGSHENRLKIPMDNFQKAKVDALNKLARTLSTSIKNVDLDNNGDDSSFTYLKSSIIFKNVVVQTRYISDNNVYVIVAIDESDIAILSQ